MLKIAYKYDPQTLEYIGEILIQQDPINSNQYLLPPYVTPINPPQTNNTQVAIFVNNEWVIENNPLTDLQIAMNNYILFCRLLGIQDRGTMTEIKNAAKVLKASNKTITLGGDVLTPDEVCIEAIALIHEVEVNGGKWIEIKYQEPNQQ